MKKESQQKSAAAIRGFCFELIEFFYGKDLPYMFFEQKYEV